MNETAENRGEASKTSGEALWQKLKKLSADSREKLHKLNLIAGKSRKGSMYFPYSDDGKKIFPKMLVFQELTDLASQHAKAVLEKKYPGNYTYSLYGQYYPFESIYTKDGWYDGQGKMPGSASELSIGAGDPDMEELEDLSVTPMTLIYRNVGYATPDFSDEQKIRLLKNLGCGELLKENLIAVGGLLNVVTDIVVADCLFDNNEDLHFDSLKVEFSLNFSKEEYEAALETEKEKGRFLMELIAKVQTENSDDEDERDETVVDLSAYDWDDV